MAAKRITLPITPDDIHALRAGEEVLLSGPLYTARDAAHKRLVEAMDAGEELAVDLRGQTIYYCGPSPAPPGKPIGAAGPTTSSRMDPYAPRLYVAGVVATIGKGQRAAVVRETCRQLGRLYLVAIGGAGALLGQRIKSAQVVAYPDLGAEAIRLLQVEEFPAIVAYDACGGSVFADDEPLQ